MNQPSNTFEMLHPIVKKWIWDSNWDALKDIQEKSIRSIIGNSHDVIITAGTASGKTEAAYLPILSNYYYKQPDSVFAIYISPLKALINDQFERLEQFITKYNLTATPWHGDVSQNVKSKLIKNPKGILLITPESLEAILVNHGYRVNYIFKDLSYIIIDEIHALVNNTRGIQLRSLLSRLELQINKKVQIIGLSATLGSFDDVRRYVRHSDDVGLIQNEIGSRNIKMKIYGFELNEEDEEGSNLLIYQNIYKNHNSNTNLIFANNKATIEIYADALNDIAKKDKSMHTFVVHHGNVSKDYRRDAEKKLKDKYVNVTAICSSTLELGVDIGNVDSVSQIGIPPSVSSLLQRLGRSGRGGDSPSKLRVFMTENAISSNSNLLDNLRIKSFHTYAMIELMREKWIEPNDVMSYYGILIHQIMAMIAQKGGLLPSELERYLNDNKLFDITKEELILLFKSMNDHQLIKKMSDNTWILDRKGDNIANHYSFYITFYISDDYRLYFEDNLLGTLPVKFPLKNEQYLIFLGKRWIVKDVNEQSKTIKLDKAEGKRPPIFASIVELDIHEKIRLKMYELYMSDEIPAYGTTIYKKFIDEGRKYFNLYKLNEKNYIETPGHLYLFLWDSDRTANTIVLIFEYYGLKAYHSNSIIILDELDFETSKAILKKYIEGDPENISLLEDVNNLELTKYDKYLPVELLKKQYMNVRLDFARAKMKINEILKW